MATTRSVLQGDVGWADQQLSAGVADNVIFPQEVENVEVLSDGVAAVWVCVTGDDAAVPSAGSSTKCRKIPAGSVSTIVLSVAGRKVSLISSGTPTYSVAAA